MVHTEKRSSRRRVEMVFGSIVVIVYVPLFIRVLSATSAGNPDPGGGGGPWNTSMVVNVTQIGAYSATLTWGGPNVTDVAYRLSVEYRHHQDEVWQRVQDLRFTGKTSHVLNNLQVHSWYYVCVWLDLDYGNFTGYTSNKKVCQEFVTKHVLTRDAVLAIIVATILGCMILVMIGTCVVDVYFYTIKGHDREDDIVMVRASLIPYIDKNQCPCQDKDKLQRKQSKKQKKPKPSGMYGLRGGKR